MGPKIVGRQPLKELPQRTCQTSHAGRTFAIGEQGGAIAIFDVNGPDAVYGVEPTLLFDMKTQSLQLGLQGVDGGFKWRVFAWNKTLCGHGRSLMNK